MSNMALTWAWEQADVRSASEASVLAVLADHANEEFMCFPSQARISARTRLSVRTVRRSLYALQERGVISVVDTWIRRRDKYGEWRSHRGSNEYQLNLPSKLQVKTTPDCKAYKTVTKLRSKEAKVVIYDETKTAGQPIPDTVTGIGGQKNFDDSVPDTVTAVPDTVTGIIKELTLTRTHTKPNPHPLPPTPSPASSDASSCEAITGMATKPLKAPTGACAPCGPVGYGRDSRLKNDSLTKQAVSPASCIDIEVLEQPATLKLKPVKPAEFATVSYLSPPRNPPRYTKTALESPKNSFAYINKETTLKVASKAKNELKSEVRVGRGEKTIPTKRVKPVKGRHVKDQKSFKGRHVKTDTSKRTKTSIKPVQSEDRVLVEKCLPASWVAKLGGGSFRAISRECVKLTAKGFTPQKIQQILSSNNLPIEVKNVSGLILYRLKNEVGTLESPSEIRQANAKRLQAEQDRLEAEEKREEQARLDAMSPYERALHEITLKVIGLWQESGLSMGVYIRKKIDWSYEHNEELDSAGCIQYILNVLIKDNESPEIDTRAAELLKCLNQVCSQYAGAA